MNSEKAQKIYKLVMLVVLTAVITFMITSLVMYNVVGKNSIKYVTVSGDSSSLAKTFTYLKNFIEKNYIGDLDEQKMLQEAIKGYVKGLGDEYSEYITSDEMKGFMEDTNGRYVGIGIYIANNTQTNQILVLMPMEGSPAQEAGIQSGDIIVKINGEEYKGDQLTEASNKMKGEEGSKVKLEILREDKTIEIEVERKNIKVNHIESEMLSNQIGYLQLSTFDDGTAEEFKAKYEELQKQGAKSLIIDLRNNGGGIVKEATDIADMMIEKGKTLLITSSKNEEEEITKAQKDRSITIPVVVLVNKNSASASEILAAALKESDNAKIVGEKTYGKGVIQTIYTLSDGSGLKLTTNEYFTPNHNVINKIGITPDIEVSLPEGKTMYTVEQDEDTQLQKAIEILK
ncbi:MAG: S41 family peptidase [Clostridia bacterium]